MNVVRCFDGSRPSIGVPLHRQFITRLPRAFHDITLRHNFAKCVPLFWRIFDQRLPKKRPYIFIRIEASNRIKIRMFLAPSQYSKQLASPLSRGEVIKAVSLWKVCKSIAQYLSDTIIYYNVLISLRLAYNSTRSEHEKFHQNYPKSWMALYVERRFQLFFSSYQ